MCLAIVGDKRPWLERGSIDIPSRLSAAEDYLFTNIRQVQVPEYRIIIRRNCLKNLRDQRLPCSRACFGHGISSGLSLGWIGTWNLEESRRFIVRHIWNLLITVTDGRTDVRLTLT